MNFPHAICRRTSLQALALLACGSRAALAEDAPPQSLRVLCYNIHHGRGTDDKVDLARQARVITATRPDLVALQEVDHKTMRTNGVDQTAELARLTGLHGQFCRQIDFEGGEYGQALLSRWPISAPTIHWLPGMPPRERRIAAEVRVDVPGCPLSLVSTHLHHISDQFRQDQCREINAVFAKPAHPVILAGDFNANPDSKPLEILREAWSFTPTSPALFSFPAEKPEKQIDYLGVRLQQRLRVTHTEVIDEAVASDHRPVLAIIEVLAGS